MAELRVGVVICPFCSKQFKESEQFVMVRHIQKEHKDKAHLLMPNAQPSPDPKTPWKMTQDDIKYLRSLRISHE